MKSLLVALSILGGGIAFTAVLVNRPPDPSPSPAAVQAEKLTAQKRAAELRAARIKEQIEMRERQEEDERMDAIDRQVAAALARPPSGRLPPHYHWSRCLLVVQGVTRISGRCAYTMEGGGLHIDGPRQVFRGIDFPEPHLTMEDRSADYWAQISRDPDGTWDGYGNTDIEEVHGDHPLFGPLRRRGSCWLSKIARTCLWKK